jgi:ABC-type Fe3+-hydroxamate transport system substrate-binding protein
VLLQLAIIGFVIVACFILRELSTINTQLTQIMATQAELAAELAAKTAQVRKAIDEITTRLAALEEAVRNAPATPELTAAVAALSTAVQAADDIVPDAPPPPA